MRLITLVRAAVVVLLFSSNAFATPKLFISLDVEAERSPDWVCVVTPTFVCNGNASPSSQATACQTTSVTDFKARLSGSKLGTVNGFGTNGAVTHLQRIHDDQDIERCDDVNRKACEPDIKFGDLETGHIVCGGAERRSPSRVLVLGLGYNTARTPGVASVDLNGGNAVTVSLQAELPGSAVTFVHILGGDFAPSITPFVGDRDSIVVKPNPRCNRFLAVMPAHEDPISTVKLSSASFGLQECRASEPFTTALPIELPYTPPNERKVLRIEYQSSRVTTKSEASWNQSLPPAAIEMGVRLIRFAWEPPGCLADIWPADDPPGDPKLAKAWNAHCPMATIGNDTLCAVRYDAPKHEPAACHYTCEVSFNRDPLRLPLPVHFNRVRAAIEHAPPESVYRWDDELSFSGQRLRSSVAPEKRKVTLEFEDRHDWTDLLGDKLDAVRVINRGASDQLELSGRNGAEPPKWTALATPNRECTDQVRIAVFGTHTYNERARTVEHGRLELPGPYAYRSSWRFHVLGGAGLAYERFPYLSVPTLELGAGVNVDLKKFHEWDWWLNRARVGFLSLNIEASAQIANIVYRGIEHPPATDAFPTSGDQLQKATHIRADLRIGIELAQWRRLAFGVAGGIGYATPIRREDNDRVGRARPSYTFELNAPIVLLPRRVWLVLYVGQRRREQHFDYTTDFLGEPTPLLRAATQWMFGLRLRGRLG